MHAEKCPVCNGTGKFNDLQCHGCDGKGWVLVPNGETEKIYVPIYPIYPTYPHIGWPPNYTYDNGTADPLPSPIIWMSTGLRLN